MVSHDASSVVENEIILSAIRATVDEMEFVIGRTAMSDGFRDKKDYFVGIFDIDGRMIHALTSYSGAGMVNPVLRHFDVNEMKQGDIYFFNDPYASNGAVQHLPDSVVVCPIFFEGQVLALATGFGHVADVGGSLMHNSGQVQDVFDEGVGYPPIRVGQNYAFDDSFLRLIGRNSRHPDLIRGDLSALHAACRLAEQRMVDLVGRYGYSVYRDMLQWAWSSTAQRARELIAQHIPDGEYRASQNVHVGGHDCIVAVKLHKADGRVTLDLTESSDQVKGPWNYHSSLDGVRLLFALQLLVWDASLLMNEGLLEVIDDAEFREGSIVRPRFPAPLNRRSQVKSAVSNCLAKIMVEASGGAMTAPQPTYVVVSFFFNNGAEFSETAGVGLGARPFADGPDVIYAPAQRNYPVEMVEAKYPLRVEKYGLRQDSGGSGEFRGGTGVVRRIRVLADARVSPNMSNTSEPSEGVHGGGSGALGRVRVQRLDGTWEEVDGTRSNVAVASGEVVEILTPGGGGWGEPSRRQTQSINRDLAKGVISEAYARDHYSGAK